MLVFTLTGMKMIQTWWVPLVQRVQSSSFQCCKVLIKICWGISILIRS